MIDIYTAAVYANLRNTVPALRMELRKGLARLAAGLVLMCWVYGSLF